MTTAATKPVHIAPRRRRAFTLLESLLALIILASIIAACLQLRSHSNLVAAKAEQRTLAANRTEALFQCVINGLLGAPETTEESAETVWRGTQGGVPYTVVRTFAAQPNPARGQVAYPVAESIALFRYRVTLGQTTSEFLWHR